jgi:hypothetical protein
MEKFLTDAKISGFQSEIHARHKARRGCFEPVLPYGHRELLEEQWTTLRWGCNHGRDSVQRDDHKPYHRIMVQTRRSSDLPAISHPSERDSHPSNGQSQLPL